MILLLMNDCLKFDFLAFMQRDFSINKARRIAMITSRLTGKILPKGICQISTNTTNLTFRTLEQSTIITRLCITAEKHFPRTEIQQSLP